MSSRLSSPFFILVFLTLYPTFTSSFTPADPTTTLTIDFTFTNLDISYVATTPALQFFSSAFAGPALLDVTAVKILTIDDLNATSNLYTNPNRRRQLRTVDTTMKSLSSSLPLSSSSFFRGVSGGGRRLAKTNTVQITAELTLPSVAGDAANTIAATSESTLSSSYPKKVLFELTNSNINEFDQSTITNYAVTGGSAYGGSSFSLSYVFTIPFARDYQAPPPPPAPSPEPEKPLLSPVQILIVACSVGAFAFISLLVGLLLCWRSHELKKVAVSTDPAADDPVVVQPPPPPKYQFSNPNRLQHVGQGKTTPPTNNSLKERYDDAVSQALEQETNGNYGTEGTVEGKHNARKQSYNPRHHHSRPKVHHHS